MSEPESMEEKAPDNLVSSGAPRERAFFNVNHYIENLVINFAAHVGNDKRFNLFARTHAVFNIGIIAGVNETLWKAYHFGPAHDILDKPENVAQYTTLWLRLKALYEKYRSEKKVSVGDILEELDNIVTELIDFSREIMKQSKCEQPQKP